MTPADAAARSATQRSHLRTVKLNWRWEGLHWQATADGSFTVCPFIRGLPEQQARQRSCLARMAPHGQSRGARRLDPAVSLRSTAAQRNACKTGAPRISGHQ